MRKILVGLVAVLVLQAGLALAAEDRSPEAAVEAAAYLGQQSQAPAPNCLPSSAPPELEMSYLDGPAGEVIAVLCCCNTWNGSCCNYQQICGGMVFGCLCQ